MADENTETRQPAAEDSGRWFPYSGKEGRRLLLLLVIYLVFDAVIGLTFLFLEDLLYTEYSRWFFVFWEMLFVAYFVCVVCQFLLPPIWATLFQGSYLLRIALGALMAVLLMEWLVFWFMWREGFRDLMEAMSYALMMVLIAYFFVQLPFWGLRWWFSWRVVRRGEERQPLQRVRQLRLVHLFAWPLFIATPLAIMRVFVAWEGFYLWGEMLITILITCLIGFVAGLFYLWITLGSRRPVRAAFVVIVICFVISFGFERLYGILSTQTIFPPYEWEILGFLGLFFLGGTLGALMTIVPTTIIFRSLGWRLAIGRKGWVSGRP